VITKPVVLKESVLKFLKLDSLIENLTGYVEARIELTKLEIKEDLAKGLAKVAVFMIMGAVLTLFVILMSIAVALLIGKSVGTFGGFSIVAGFYFLLALLVYGFRNPITEKLQDQLVQIMNKKKE
jgi:hypothetical protein